MATGEDGVEAAAASRSPRGTAAHDYDKPMRVYGRIV
jgi:hypothetical protein